MASAPEASAPSHPMLTMVGLGPPLQLEEPPLAGTTAYVAEETLAPRQRTIVGFPAAPEQIFDGLFELEEAPNDEITAVMSYDEVTVVARIPAPDALGSPPARPAAEQLKAAPASERDEVAPASDGVSHAAEDVTEVERAVPSSPVTAQPSEPMATSGGDPEVAAAELVESEPEIRLFAPSLESLVPPGRSLGGAPVAPVALRTSSEAPWFVSVDAPKPARFPRMRHIVAGGVLAGAVFLGAFALPPSTGEVLVTVGGPDEAIVSGAVVYVDGERACSPAPCRVTVSAGSHVIGVDAPSYRRPAARALAVGRGSEEAMHFTVLPGHRADAATPAVQGMRIQDASKGEPAPSAEVLSVGELQAQSDALAKSPVARPAPTLTATAPMTAPMVAAPRPESVDLDGPYGNAAVGGTKLSITASPPCNVVLDGRPLGKTPHEVTVAPGAHSVVFIHPTEGRRSMRVEAVPGKPAVASVTF
jgi:hypothetical protein